MKKIAFIWYKGIWKDFFQENLALRIKEDKKGVVVQRKALGDVLKLMSSEPIHSDWEYNGYLLDDILTFLNTPMVELYKGRTDKEVKYIDEVVDFLSEVELEKGILKNIWKIKEKHLSLKKYFTDEEKLFIINLFKNIPNLKTRISLQTFWDYYKEKQDNTFIFSELLTKEVKKEKHIDYLFNTDTRFLSELLTFLEDDYIVFYLYHEDMFNANSGKIDTHLSEMELALSKNLYDTLVKLEKEWKSSLIKMINLTPKKWEEGEKVLWFNRLKTEDLLKKIENAYKFIENKEPLSVKDKEKIKSMKQDMLMNKDLMKPFEDFSNVFIKYNLNKSAKNEKALKESYEKYQEYNQKMISRLLK